MNLKENISGLVLLVAVLLLGNALLDSAIFFRLLIGLGLGYAVLMGVTGSGWIFLVFMVAGGVFGNMLGRRLQTA